MFEEEAIDSFNGKKVLYKWETDKRSYIGGFSDGAEFGYNKGKAETALLSQHIIELQKDKGNLTDKVRELEQQIEKMKTDYEQLLDEKIELENSLAESRECY